VETVLVFGQQDCDSPTSNNHRFTRLLLMVYFSVGGDHGSKYRDRCHCLLRPSKNVNLIFGLAKPLSVRYPRESEEKRFFDAMLLTVPS